MHVSSNLGTYHGNNHFLTALGDGDLNKLLPHLAVVILQVAAFTLKVLFFCWLQILLRWSVPRFRYDQVMRLGWKMMLPLALLNVAVTALIIVAAQ